MRIRVSSLVGLTGSTVIAALLMLGGCAGTKSSTDSDAEGGTPSETGGSSAGGSTSTGAGGTTSANGGAAPAGGAGYAVAGNGAYICRKGVPTSGVVAPGTNGIWGTSSPISGGVFGYQDVDTSKFTVDTTTTTGSITLTASLVANGYAGYGIYFKDPQKCWDLSQFTGGIRVTMSGDLGGGALQFQVQTNSNYPIDTTNNKGGCTGTWSDGCGNNSFTVESVATTPTAVEIPWASLTGGLPISPVDRSEILGIQWQINCPAETCTPSLTIGEVAFY